MSFKVLLKILSLIGLIKQDLYTRGCLLTKDLLWIVSRSFEFSKYLINILLLSSTFLSGIKN